MVIKKIAKKPIKKAVKKIVKPKEKLKELGLVTHYFDKIKVAVIKLKQPIKLGDTIRIIGGEKTDFKQTVKSMEVNHRKISRAKKGDDLGIKIKEVVREGYKVYKV
jgi:putative protease